jgi:thiopurine S-methyltransferase
MQADLWQDRWRSGQIGFHQNEATRPLAQFWPRLKLPHGSSVFVPLCGKSLDLLWLRDQPHDVIGAELSEIGVESFLMENGVLARRHTCLGFNEYTAPGLRLLQGDFFELTRQMLEPVAANYDRASLIALPVELQARYVEKLIELTAPGTQTLLVTLEYPQSEMAGPPFSVDSLSVTRLYSVHHRIRELHREDILAKDPKLRARGVTQLYEVCYHLTRL